MFAANAVSVGVPGTSWTLNSSVTLASGWAVVDWNSSQFLTMSTNNVLTSPDGVTWTRRTDFTTKFSGRQIYGLAFGGSTYVVCGTVSGSAPTVGTSTDAGVTWTLQTGPAWGTGKIAYAAAWNGTTFLICGTSNNAATSTDGVTWTNQTGLATAAGASGTSLYAAVLGTKFYVVVTGTGGGVAQSSDGVTWSHSTAFTPTRIISGGGKLLASSSSVSTIWISSDGTNWTSLTGPTGLAGWTGGSANYSYALGQYFALGTAGNLAASYDGQNWRLLTGYYFPIVGNTVGSGAAQAVGGNSGIVVTFGQLGSPTFALRAAYSR
jgi:hypothetical protein